MQKKGRIVLFSLVLIALVSSGVFIFNNQRIKTTSEKQFDTTKSLQIEETKETAETVEVKNDEIVLDKPVEVLNRKDITVKNNSPEYDLRAWIYENAMHEVFLKLEYFIDGASIVKELDTRLVPEISSMFESKGSVAKDKKLSKIDAIYLHAKNNKAYFFMETNTNLNSVDISIYSVNLKDFNAKKIFSGKGRFTEILFTKNLDYLAFSFNGDESSKSSSLQILRCKTDEFIVNKSKDLKGANIGNNNDNNSNYEYMFIGWNSNSVMKLKQTVYAKSSGNSASQIVKQTDILYDVEKNVFLNPDGSILVIGENGEKVPQQIKVDSDAVKALKEFTNSLSAEQYNKAYDMLDDKFQFSAFQLLGIDELSKKDIDVNAFAMYGSIFKTIKIDSIVEEQISENTATVYFYQAFSVEKGDEIRQPIKAGLKKTATGWKISSVLDGNINEKPFKK